MAQVSQFDFPPALPREGWAGSVSPENDKPALFRGVVYEPSEAQGTEPLGLTSDPTEECTPSSETVAKRGELPPRPYFDFPAGQRQQGMGCAILNSPESASRGFMPDSLRRGNESRSAQPIDFPAASPHNRPQAGTAGPARTPAQGGGQLPSFTKEIPNGRKCSRLTNAQIWTRQEPWQRHLHDVRVQAEKGKAILPQQDFQEAPQPAQVTSFGGSLCR